MSYYQDHAQEYIDATLRQDLSEAYALFEPHLKAGASILDVGFGSGRDMLYFKSKGYEVFGIDLEDAFVAHALELGLDATKADALAYSPEKRFDGIWACASLVHFDEERFLFAIKHLLSLLKDDGVLFVSMKFGKKFIIDEKGRPMLYVREESFKPFHVIESKRTLESGRGIAWINVVMGK